MTIRTALGFVRDRSHSWLSIVRLIPLAGWSAVICLFLVNLALGLLPVMFIVATSVALERFARLTMASPGTDGRAAVFSPLALAIGAFVVQSALSPSRSALSELVIRRVDSICIRRLMTFGLVSAPMPLLEQRDVLDKLLLTRQYLAQRWQTPGGAVDGLLALTARYTQFIGAVVLAGVAFGPSAAALLGVTTVVLRLSTRGSQTRWVMYAKKSLARPYRMMMYVFGVGSDAAAGKEVRVLGILPWLQKRAATESGRYFDPLWKERRRIYFAPFLAVSAVILAGVFALLMLMRVDVATDGVSALRLALGIQAILVPLRMGTFFPESDLKTMWGMAAYDNLSELEALTEAGAGEKKPPKPATSVTGLPRSYIRFENVQFTYPAGDRAILSGLDLELAAGTSTAIVGLNGVGKTTLIKLLARLYEPDGGRITVDGIDIRNIDARSWQRRLAVIFQDYVKYQLDAAANIGIGAVGHLRDMAALRAAADWAGAEGIIGSLPIGFATPLSSQFEGGVDLSGGQWQRIALARALFAVGAGASVLVLDEPTAQLDARAEVAFLDRFLELTSGLTTVVISHRFSTVRHASTIVVLEDGRIREKGSHDELVRAGGRYAELFHLQARRFGTETLAEAEEVS